MARRAHEKTDVSIAKVTALAMVGVPHHDIALLADISIKTLLKHYRVELDKGKAQANAKIAGRLYALASNEKSPNLGAICFWLKCQAGWRETQVIQNQHLDKNGNPVDPPKLGISFEDGGPGRAGVTYEQSDSTPKAPRSDIH